MSEIKKAIANKIGDTSRHKQRVWGKLQRSPKKSRRPLLIMMSFVIILVLFIGTSGVWQKDSETAVENTSSPTSELYENMNSAVPFTVLQFKPKNQHNYPAGTIGGSAVFIAENKQQLEEYARLFNLSVEAVDFTQSNVAIVEYYSDSCGRLVESLAYEKGKLSIQLNYPAELQQKDRFACITVAYPTTAMLLVPKLDIIEAEIVSGTRANSATLNRFREIE